MLAHQPSVEVRVEIEGEIPANVTMYYSSAGGLVDQPVEMHLENEGQAWYRAQLIGDGGRGLMRI